MWRRCASQRGGRVSLPKVKQTGGVEAGQLFVLAGPRHTSAATQRLHAALMCILWDSGEPCPQNLYPVAGTTRAKRNCLTVEGRTKNNHSSIIFLIYMYSPDRLTRYRTLEVVLAAVRCITISLYKTACICIQYQYLSCR